MGALVALIGFSSYASDIQLTIAFVGCSWCFISAGIAAVLWQLDSLKKLVGERNAGTRDEFRDRQRPREQYREPPRQRQRDQYQEPPRQRQRDQRRDPDF